MTFAGGANTPTLKITNSNGTGSTWTMSGGFSGPGNIQLNPTSTGSAITLSGTSVNNTGTISNIGASTQTSTISAPIGASVTGISQAGANPFTISSSVPVSATLNTFTSSGAGIWTFSGGFAGTGTTALTLNANAAGGITSTGAIAATVGNVILNANGTGAITLSTGAVTPTGTITNSGTAGGVTTISSNIGVPTTNVFESSANSPLILSGTNSYTGTSNSTAGVLSFTTTLAIPGYATSPATAFGSFATPKLLASSGATIALPYGAATNAVTTTDIANFMNGTYGGFAAGSSLGIDTTNGSVTNTLSTVITDTTVGKLGFTKMGTNTLSLGSANTYTGRTAVVNGTLTIGSINSVSGAPSSLGQPTTVSDGTISLGLGTSTGNLSYTGVAATTDRVINFAGTTGGGAISHQGTGPLTFTAPATFTGIGTKTVVFDNQSASLLTFSGAFNGGISTNVNGATDIQKTGTGNLALTGGGTIRAISAWSGGNIDLGSSNWTISDAGSTTIVSSANVVLNGTGIVTFAGNTATDGPDIRPGAGTTLTINPIIGPMTFATAAFENNGAGTVILTNQNTYAGGNIITVAGGTIQFSNIGTAAGIASNLGTGATLYVGNGTFKYTGTGETTSKVLALNASGGSLDQSGTGLLKFTAATTAPGANVKTVTLTGSSAGTGEIAGAILDNSTTNTTSIIKTGTGTWTLSGANTYTGTTTVNAGSLTLSGTAGAIVSPVTINGGTLLINNLVTANNGNRLGNTLAVQIGTTGTLSFANDADAATSYSETTGALTINTGGGTISSSQAALGQTSALTFASLANTTASTINFTGTGLGVDARNRVFITAQANGNLPAWARYNTTDYAAYDSTNGVTIAAYTNIDTMSAVVPNTATADVRINNVNGTTNDTLAAVTTTINTLTQAATGPSTLDLQSTRILQTTGISIQPSSSDLTIGASVNDGNLTPTTAGGTLNLSNFSNSTLKVNSVIANNTSASNLIIDGTGVTELAGASTFTGNTVVYSGTLNLTGSLNGLVASSALRYGDNPGKTVVNVSGNVNNYFITTGANVAGSVAVLNQTGGTVSIVPTNGQDLQYLANNGGYGMLNVTGGTFNTGRFDGVGVAGTAASAAVIYVGGTGTINQPTGDWFLPIRTNGMMSMTVAPGGSFTRQAAVTSQFSIIGLNGTNTYGVFNVAGGTADTGTKGINFSQTSFSPGTGNVGFVNAAGGTLLLGLNTGVGAAAGSTSGFFNFAGGTLKSTAAMTAVIPANTANYTFTSTLFGPITNNNNANTAFNTQIGATSNFTGGLVVDTNTFATTFTNALLGASGNGVTQANIGDMSLLAGNSGYIGAPMVQFAAPAGGGDPASGYAVISGGQVTGIVITNPGVYASGETPLITLTGGGGAIAPFAVSALTTANVSGGVIKNGAGTLTLSGTNTYSGTTTVNNGVLQFVNQVSLYNNTPANWTDAKIVVNSGAILALSVGGAGQFLTTDVDTIKLLGTNTGGFLGGSSIGIDTTAGNLSYGTTIADTNNGANSVGFAKLGTNTLTLTNNANTYTGPTTLLGGTLSVAKIDVGGNTSGIGASTSAASNLVLRGGTLQYTGTGDTTNRNYTFGNASIAAGGGFDTTGATGPLVISGNMTGANTAAGTQVLTLTSLAASGANALNGNIVDSSATALTGVTKAGVGAWTLGGANTYSGPTVVSAGTLNLTGTSAPATPGTNTLSVTGTLNVNSSGSVAYSTVTTGAATTINFNSGTLLESGNMSGTGTLSFNGGTLKSAAPFTIGSGIPINVQAGGGTIDTTGGSITSSSGLSNTASPGTFNLIGGNTLQIAVNATQTGPVNITGTGTTLRLVTTAAVYPNVWTVGTGAILDINNVGNFSFAGLAGGGNVINTGATAARTVTITGAGGNTFSGAIQQPTVSSTLTSGVTVNLGTSSATQTFSGTNTYSGPTTITQGRLALTGGVLDNTAISVAVNGTIAPTGAAGSFTAGNATTAGLGASLNIASGGTLTMQDANVGIFTLTQNASFATAPLTLTSSNLFFDIGSAGPDQIVVSGSTVAGAFTGTNVVNLTGVGPSLTPGTYSLITAPGITAANTVFKFSNGLTTMSLPVGLNSYPLTLTSVAGIEQLTVGAGLGNYTWTGQINGNGVANSVWVNPAAGNNNFADASPAVQDYADGSSVTFQDLNVITAANVTNSLVNIDAAGVLPGSVTVNNNAVNYTFNTSGSVGIAGAVGINKTGSGTLTLSSVNTYSGTTNINGGVVNVGIGTALGSGIISFGGGTLQYGTGLTTDFSSRFSTAASQLINIDTNGNNVTFATALTSAGGSLIKNGTGTLTLTSTASTANGTAVVNGGTLKISAANAAGGPIQFSTITLNNGGTLETTVSDAIGFTANRNVLIINSGGTVLNNTAGTRDTLINTVTMTGGFLAGTSVGDANSGAFSLNNATSVIATSDAAGNPATISANVSTQAVGVFQVNRGTGAVAPGVPDLIISGPITPYGAAGTNGITVKGSGILNLTGANTYKGNVSILGGTLGGIVNANSTQALGNNTALLVMGDTTGLTGLLNVNQNNTVTGLTVNTTGAVANMNTINLAAGKTLTSSGATNVGNTATGSNNTLLTVAGTPTSTLTLGGSVTIGSTTGNGGPGAQNSQLIVNGGTGVNINLGAGALNIGYRNNSGTGVATVQPTSGMLDLSAAGNVSIAGTSASTILLGSSTSTSASGNAFDVTTGTLKLSTAGTNTVTVGTITLGTSPSIGQAGIQGFLTLGNAANNLNVDTFYVGRQKSAINGSLQSLVNFAGTGGTLTLKGFAGGATKTALNIGYNDPSGTGTVTTATMDLTGGSFNGQLSTLTVGFYNTGAGSGGGKGTFTMTAGATTLNSLVLANRGGSTSLANNTGTVNLSGGSLTFNSGGTGITSNTTAATSGVATINLSGTGLIELSNQPITIDGTGSAINMNGGTLSNVSTYSVNASTNVTNAGALIQRNIAGTSTFGNIAFTGPTASLSVTAGTVSTTGISTTDAAASVTLDGGTLNVNGGSIGGATAVVANLRSGTLQNVAQINNGAALSKTTVGTLTIAGTNSYTGNLAITSGTLRATTNSALGTTAGNTNVSNGAVLSLDKNGGSDLTIGAEALTLNGPGLTGTPNGALRNVSGNNSFAGAITLGSASAIQSDASQLLTLTGGIDTAGSLLTVQGNGDTTISTAAIIGGGGLTKLDAGTLTLASTNTYSGTTTISAGKLQLGDGTPGNDGTIANSLSIVNNANLTYNRFGAASYGGVISGTGTVTKLGVGTQTLTGTNTYSGTTTITAGTLQLGNGTTGNDGTIANSLSIVNNANLTYNRFGAASYGGVISGSGSVTKLGAGSQTLSGTNLYSGSTTVSAGKLIIDSTGSINSTSGVTVNGGEFKYNSATTYTQPITLTSGTISGTGTIGTALTVGAGAILSPGNSPGIQPYGATQTWNPGGTYTWEVNNWTTTVAGTDYDQIAITGGLNIAALSSPASKFNIDINGLTAGNTVGAVPGFNNTIAHSWTILTTTTGITGQAFDPNLFNLVTTNFSGANAGGSFSLSTANSGNDLVLNFVPVVTTTATTYTLGAVPATLNILKGGNLAASSTITNTGSGTADTLNYTTLSGTSGNTGIATVSGSASGSLAQGANAMQNLLITGVANGSTTVTSSVASATNATVGGSATLTPPAGMISVVVGTASYAASPNSSTTFGQALTALTPVSATYNDLSSTTTAGPLGAGVAPSLGTTATLLNYTNSTPGDSGIVSMAWRSRTASEAASKPSLNDNGTKAVGYLLSDVVDLTGMTDSVVPVGPNGYAVNKTDTFVLQLSYNEALLDGHEAAGVNHGNIFIVSRDNGGNWINAVLDNIGGTAHYVGSGNYDPMTNVLGDYGINPTTNTVWAVLNHNSEFAVIPEPSTLVLGGLAVLGLAGMNLRRRRTAK